MDGVYLGLESTPWGHTDWVLGQFGRRLTTCRKRYAEIADRFHRDVATLSQTVRRFDLAAALSPAVAQELQAHVDAITR